MRYRLDVIAPNVLDVVDSIGGWLFDRAIGGWDVNVMVDDHDNRRPLKILGARSFDIRHALISSSAGPPAQALAVAADPFCRDERVRRIVQQALQHRPTEVTLWGEPRPVELEPWVDETRYELSSAARIFKSYALAAASGREITPVADTEIFRYGTIARPLPLRALSRHGLRV